MKTSHSNGTRRDRPWARILSTADWFRRGIRLLLPACALGLAGCATFSEDGGFASVSSLTRERTGHVPAYQRKATDIDGMRDRLAELLAQPLTADSAVEISLFNNRDLQARFAELGIAEADLVRAGRLHNPSFSFGRLGGAAGEIDRALVFDVVGLVTLPTVKRIAQKRFELAQWETASEAVALATAARRTFFSAVAAQQVASYYGQVESATAASSELAQRMFAAGNFSRLEMMREQAFHLETTTLLAQARQRAVAEREQLCRVLGLGSDQAGFRLPDRLPDLPAEVSESKDAETVALKQRLDVAIARNSVDATAKSLGLSKATRMVNVLDAGYQNRSTQTDTLSQGYEVTFELPLFDFGTARVARAEATYMQAVHRAAAVAVNAQSEVREAYSAYRSAYGVAKQFRDEIVPLRKRISEENLLRYNGMLASVFDLLVDSRAQMAAIVDAVQSSKAFWMAESDLSFALNGKSSGAPSSVASQSSLATASADH